MISPPALRYETMAPDDFEELVRDMPDDERWELIGGRVVRGMVGARLDHKRIVQNMTNAMLNRFRATASDCRPFDETFWLKDKARELQLFPDIMVRCGLVDNEAQSISDPAVIVEVLSPSSEARDRTEKWALYQTLPSLQHYVLVARGKPRIEVFTRSGREWAYQALVGLDAMLSLPAVEFAMPLADIYADVIAA